MSTRVSQFVLNKPGNLGAADKSGISAQLTIQLHADEDTGDPVGIVVVFDKLMKNGTVYVPDSLDSGDNYVAVSFTEEEGDLS